MDALEETCDNLPGDYADRCKGECLAYGSRIIEFCSHH